MSDYTIKPEEVKAAAISSLSNTPNRGGTFGTNGLSAEGLKACFDALPKLIVARFNALVEALERGEFGGGGDVPVGTGLPPITDADDGKILQVIGGEWAAMLLSLPTRLSELINDMGYIDEGGAPVKSVNGHTGAVRLAAEDVGADRGGTAYQEVSEHNVSDASHSDIRLLLSALAGRVNAALNSTDVDLDQLSEIVAYIKNNSSLIAGVTTSKVNVSDIIDNLTTNIATKPLSAAQGVTLKGLIDALESNKLATSALTNAINTALAQAQASGDFDGATYTPYVNALTGYLSWSNNKGLPNPERIKIKGEDAFSPIVSVSKSDKVTTITINDKSGAKTATINDGADGSSVSVSSVSESTASGGSNVVTFSDGKKVTVKNGKDGKNGDNGKTPVKGEDYFTDADKEDAKGDVAQLVIETLKGLPVFGVIDENKHITTTTLLPDGTYTLVYDNKDGTTTELTTFVIGGAVAIINVLASAVGAQGTILNDVGFNDGSYLTGNPTISGNNSFMASDSACFTTGFIPYTVAQAQSGVPIYIKGVTIDTTNSHTRMGGYPSYDYAQYIDPIKFSSGNNYIVVEQLADEYYKITPTAKFMNEINLDVNYVRFSFVGRGAGVIITIDQEIP